VRTIIFEPVGHPDRKGYAIEPSKGRQPGARASRPPVPASPERARRPRSL